MAKKHVIPLDDLEEHERSTSCGCRPSVSICDDGSMLVVHDAFDGREQIEEETGKPTSLGKWLLEVDGGGCVG